MPSHTGEDRRMVSPKAMATLRPVSRYSPKPPSVRNMGTGR